MMIFTVMMVSLRRLMHNRIEMMLTFVVPVAFFSIFAIIFGGGIGAGSTPQIKVCLVDEVNSDLSRAVMMTLHETAGLKFVSGNGELTKDEAKQYVRRGTASIAILLRRDQASKAEPKAMVADLLSDTSDQIAPQVVSALVMKAIMASMASIQAMSKTNQGDVTQASGTLPMVGPISVTPMTPPSVTIVDVLGANKTNGVISMYAAGIAVMFLLFGATGGGGVLLDERENQTLDRLLTTGLSMDELLLGKWAYLTALGVVQTTVMFAWGQAIFGIDLIGHFDGFLIMTIVTAGAAAAFGLLLATICRTRGQLNGLSVVVVLTMSALGGSMVPRYVMSDRMREVGLWTFNAWALDGYDKVFWRDMPVGDLWPQMSVLMLCGAVFLVTSRLLAIRWEAD